MPPLSFVDKLIYQTGMILVCVGVFCPFFLVFILRRWIAFADPAVVAMRENASFLWVLVPTFVVIVAGIGIVSGPYSDRKPIFGLKNFKYGPPDWPAVYPLFMKNKPYVYVGEGARKLQKTYRKLLITVLLLSFIPFPLSLFGRDCLNTDGSIVQYNMLNIKAHEFVAEDISHVEFTTYKYHHGRYGVVDHWGVLIRLETSSGRKYSFRHSDFRNDPQTAGSNWLDAMNNLKECYVPDIIRYNGIEDIDKVIVDKKISPKRTEKLYQLFGQ